METGDAVRLGAVRADDPAGGGADRAPDTARRECAPEVGEVVVARGEEHRERGASGAGGDRLGGGGDAGAGRAEAEDRRGG